MAAAPSTAYQVSRNNRRRHHVRWCDDSGRALRDAHLNWFAACLVYLCAPPPNCLGISNLKCYKVMQACLHPRICSVCALPSSDPDCSHKRSQNAHQSSVFLDDEPNWAMITAYPLRHQEALVNARGVQCLGHKEVVEPPPLVAGARIRPARGEPTDEDMAVRSRSSTAAHAPSPPPSTHPPGSALLHAFPHTPVSITDGLWILRPEAVDKAAAPPQQQRGEAGALLRREARAAQVGTGAVDVDLLSQGRVR